MLSSINDSLTTKGGPWGHVDSHGNWVLGNLDRFTFAEAVAPLALLPGVNTCGGSAWVQVRTRSSAQDTSDLKDTSKIFSYTFSGLRGSAALTPSCDEGFSYDAGVVDLDGNPVANASCTWTFSDGTTSTSCAGFASKAAGTYGATVTVVDPSNTGCPADVDAITAYRKLSVQPALSATCDLAFGYGATLDGGANPANVALAWSFSGGGTVSPASSDAGTGSVTVGTGNVDYFATVQASESRDGLTCTTSGNAKVRPYARLAVDLALQPSVPECPAMGGDTVTYSAVASGGDGVLSISWNGIACSGSSCTVTSAPDGGVVFCAERSLSATVSDTSGLCPAVTSETETYSKVTTITASDNP